MAFGAAWGGLYYIVDVQAIRKPHVIGYVTKYLTKSLSRGEKGIRHEEREKTAMSLDEDGKVVEERQTYLVELTSKARRIRYSHHFFPEQVALLRARLFADMDEQSMEQTNSQPTADSSADDTLASTAGVDDHGKALISLRICSKYDVSSLVLLDRDTVEAEPKTDKSRRSVMLPSITTDSLKQHRVHQLEAKLQAGEFWEEHDLVFCTSLGTPLNPNKVLERFKTVLKKAGLPDMRFHDLRHSVDVHPKVVQELLGHNQISMTMDTYSYVLPTMQKEAMSKLNDALQG